MLLLPLLRHCQCANPISNFRFCVRIFLANPVLSEGAFTPSHFPNKLDDKLAHKVASQTNVTHFCLVCQSEVCCKPNWFATNSLRQLCERVSHQVCCKNVMVETHLERVLLEGFRAGRGSLHVRFHTRFSCAVLTRFDVVGTWGAIHQLLNIILKLRILVLFLVSTLPYVVTVKNCS
jgi:hypothetical protein